MLACDAPVGETVTAKAITKMEIAAAMPSLKLLTFIVRLIWQSHPRVSKN